MATAETDTKTALQELLDERQRYEGWLRALDDRRAATPPHVYERVRTDYTLRLERVTQRLRERAEQLTATIEGMRTRLQSLRSREADRTDERHEFELRAAVGELSPEEWERRRGEADRELSAIAEDRRSVEGELAELDRIVALTREPATRAPQASHSAEATEAGEAAATSSAGFEPEEEAIAPEASGAAVTAGAVDRGEHHPLAATPDTGAPSIDDFVADCQKGLDRWNRILAPIDRELRLPHVGFHRNVGEFRQASVSPDGRLVGPEVWEAHRAEWLPNDDDRAHVASLMQPALEPGVMASWVAAPSSGIHGKPVEYEYLRL